MRFPAGLQTHKRNSAKSEERSPTYPRSVVLWLLVGAAWAVTLLAVFTRHTEWGDHHYLLQASGLPFVSALGLFLASWQVMILAMMVPSLAPLLPQMSGAYNPARAPGSHALFLLFLAGYDLVWTAFGCAAFFGDALLHELVESWSWLGTHDAIIATGLLGLAGVYQFTLRKTRFQIACRAEAYAFSQLQRAEMSRLDTAGRAGARTGLTHLGSCWALMLALVGLGMGSLVWMAALTGVMLAEQLCGPRANTLRWSVGVVCLALAVLTLAPPATLPDRFELAGPQFFW
jgi:predicted metal-binding membrane protein